MNTLRSQSDQSQHPAWSVHSDARAHSSLRTVQQRRRASSRGKRQRTHTKAVAWPLLTAALLSWTLLPSPAAAVQPEKQPIYVNIMNGSLCGIDPVSPAEPPIPCQVPAGYRLIFDHVSGYAFLPASAAPTTAVSIAIKDPKLGLGGVGELAFHTFVAAKTSTSGGTDVFVFDTPLRMMLHAGATFYFSPANNAAVSGYLVKE